MDRKVPSNCLGNKISTRCIQYDGPSYENLDIQTGDSLEWVIGRLAQAGSTSTTESTTFDLSCLQTSAVSPCGALITERSIRVSKSSSTGGVTVLWDSTSLQNALPQGQSIQTAQVLLRGTDGSVQFSGSNATAQVTIPLAAFPATFDYRLFIYTECGNIQLSGSISLDANPGDVRFTLDLIDVPTAQTSTNDVGEAISLIATEVCALKNAQ